jgi:2-aminobenzoate-CoA ligase
MAERSAIREPRIHSAHVDSFCREALPPRELWPQIDFSSLKYEERINAATELLDKTAAMHPERTVFHFARANWSYIELLENANRIARLLTEDLGLAPGNRVLVRGPNHPMLMAGWFGVLKAGGVVVCANPLLRTRELQEICSKAKISAALVDARVSQECQQAFEILGMPNANVVCFNGAHPAIQGAKGGATGPSPVEALMKTKPTSFANCDTAGDDVAIIAFTSGTTGQSKGTIHFHRDLLAVCDTFSSEVLQPQPDDVFCGSPSIAFTYGLGGLLLFPVRAGAAVALQEAGTPAAVLETIEKHRATISFTSPTGYRAMLKQLKDFDVSSLRKCVSAGEHLPRATFDAWQEATGLKIIDGIGSTEMLHMFISSAGEEIRPGATGKVVPGYEAKIVDVEGNDVPDGTVGRLAVRGVTGCRYLDNHAEQKKYVQRGWNLTGDSFRRDPDGYFWYQARTDDMIISSGYNISAVEVENALLRHPHVAECAVIGVPDEDRGNIVKAFIVAATAADPCDALAKELQDFVKAQIAPYKYPRSVEFVSALPKNANGKLQRYKLRETGHKPIEFIEPQSWPRPHGYANAISSRGRVIFLAGQIGWNPTTQKFESDDFVHQVAQALRNIATLLREAGAQPRDLVRLTWFVADRDAYMKSRQRIGEVYREIIGQHYPAMSVICVERLIEERARVEIEATAVLPE